ncbi:MAG: hypothetical protein IBX69_09045 [Anaerolineales bacterium]|nr:hypothetical protein [Anaerolineales bacterium]
MQFPNVQGSNLMREKIHLPQDFEGKINIVLIAFQQWHQKLVDSWIPAVERLETDFSGLVYYELPTIQSMNFLAKAFINEGMRAGIPNLKPRRRTITLYLDKEPFRQALEIASEDSITVLLVDKDGEVLWSCDGSYEIDKELALKEVIEATYQVQQSD